MTTQKELKRTKRTKKNQKTKKTKKTKKKLKNQKTLEKTLKKLKNRYDVLEKKANKTSEKWLKCYREKCAEEIKFQKEDEERVKKISKGKSLVTSLGNYLENTDNDTRKVLDYNAQQCMKKNCQKEKRNDSKASKNFFKVFEKFNEKKGKNEKNEKNAPKS